ncbi:MAG: proline dehydrogenase [Sphingobacteriia bacterium]|nr:proline dehydrogenase [Sphingobacteriia bacterium]
MLSFKNTQEAFRHQSDSELTAAYWLFYTMRFPWLVKIGPVFVTTFLRLGLPIKSILKKTLFKQFCGGETLTETIPRLTQMNKYGVKTILDYSVEGEKSEKGFDDCCTEICNTLTFGGQQKAVLFSACKISGLGDTELLTKVQARLPLTPAEEKSIKALEQRLKKIAETAQKNKVPVFIDAEESWFQGVIDEYVELLMKTYNRNEVIIYHTLQMYRHDRLNYLKKLKEKAAAEGFICGVKLVRGAYLEKENERAKTMGYPTPIQPDKASTDIDYNLAVEYCIQNISYFSICAGTHNEESCLRLTELMHQNKIQNSDARISFAQLLGMSDHISYNLASEGYISAKYLPYGPVKSVLPYLFRRASENTSIAGQTGREFSLLKTELHRRKQA